MAEFPTFHFHCLFVWSLEFEPFSKERKFNAALQASLATAMFVFKSLVTCFV